MLRLCIFLAILTCLAWGQGSLPVSENANTVGAYRLYELTITHDDAPYSNNWEDVSVSALFLGPAPEDSFPINGFYYERDTWKVRFAPPKIGVWTWTVTLYGQSTLQDTGSFICIGSTQKGFLKRHPTNPHRIVYADGSLYDGIGFGSCMSCPLGNGAIEAGTNVTKEQYFQTYGAAGFNFYRWSIDNCAFKLWDTVATAGNKYLVNEGKCGDQLVDILHRHGFRLMTGVFGFHPAFPGAADTAAQEAAVKRYLKYAVARYGHYTDIWEFMNEAAVPDEWLTFAARYVKSIDPYNRMVTTSYDRPKHPDIDINNPHEYKTYNYMNCALFFGSAFTTNKRQADKPVLMGEYGNHLCNWDPTSALRLRLQTWSAFFHEGIVAFWNTSGTRNYCANGWSNYYIGALERSYVKVLTDFTRNTHADVDSFGFESDGHLVNTYGLSADTIVLGYMDHMNHDTTIQPSITIDIPLKNATMHWFNPETGDTLRVEPVGSGVQQIRTPAFTIDIAFKIVGDTHTNSIKPLPVGFRAPILRNDMVGTVMYDVSGRRVLHEHGKGLATTLPSGLYFVKSRSGKLRTHLVIE